MQAINNISSDNILNDAIFPKKHLHFVTPPSSTFLIREQNTAHHEMKAATLTSGSSTSILRSR
jgi:hypothetical protein